MQMTVEMALSATQQTLASCLWNATAAATQQVTLDLKAISMTKCVLFHVYVHSCITQLDKLRSLVCVYEVPLGTPAAYPWVPLQRPSCMAL